MNLEKLFSMQKILDEHIRNQHSLQGQSLITKKMLALQVELGELANETRCFKFWSNKKPSEKDIILEEYVDCLHFILTIGIEINFTDIKLEPRSLECSITDQFVNLFIDINDFIVCSSKDHYITLFEDFLTLGNSLNFSHDDIENAYIAKNTINHERQNEGY